MSEIFTKVKLNLNPDKKNIIVMEQGEVTKYSSIFGTGRILAKLLETQFNIIYVSTVQKSEVKNLYVFNTAFSDRLDRKAQNKDYIKHNTKIIDDSLIKSFSDIKEIEYIIVSGDFFFQLPFHNYCSVNTNKNLHDLANSFFDYLGNNTKILKEINNINQHIIDNWDKTVSPIAFRLKKQNGFMRLLNSLKTKIKKHVITFSIDPAIYTPYFKLNNIPAKNYYFADDNRGTRNFLKFDISQLQHLVYEKQFGSTSLNDIFEVEKPKPAKNLFFVGTILQLKGSRLQCYYDFLHDFKDEKSAIHIPLKINGIFFKKAKGKQLKLVDDKAKLVFAKPYEDITKHKLLGDILTPDMIQDEMSKYKYNLVLRCVSPENSLNFRPVLNSYMNTLSFFDYMYDPDNLQIPKEIYDRLSVKSAEDIQTKIDYFNEHDDERIELINKLRKLFKIDEYIKNPIKMAKKEINRIIPEYRI